MRFLADDCLDGRLIARLRGAGLDVAAVRDVCRGARDREVLARARGEGRVLLTEDKDFGELALRIGEPAPGIVLFREVAADVDQAVAAFEALLASHGSELRASFAVVRGGRVRLRRLAPSDPGR